MSRPTKASIIRTLNSGGKVPYRTSASKASNLYFEKSETRRLFTYLLSEPTREAKNLSEEFLSGLRKAYAGELEGPAETISSAEAPPPPSVGGDTHVWRIQRLTTKNFGGINLNDGREFHWEMRKGSWLLAGDNGSGKTSLLGAIVWAFSGRRPRDDGLKDAHHDADVMNDSDKKVGVWPPLAAYPARVADLPTRPRDVEVKLSLVSDSGETAEVTQSFRGGRLTFQASPNFRVDDIFISTGISMPTVLHSLRLKEGDSALTQAVAQLTGLDELVHIGEFADGLCHASREYLSHAKKSGMQAKLDEFHAEVTKAREELAPVQKAVPQFGTRDSIENDGPLIQFGKGISESATGLTESLSRDLAADVDASKLDTQRSIIVSLSTAKELVSKGLAGIDVWASLERCSEELTVEVEATIASKLQESAIDLDRALEAHAKQLEDAKFRLKASAAAWHFQHSPEVNVVDRCPLCEVMFAQDSTLRRELEGLRGAAEAAQLTLSQSLPAIQNRLVKTLSASLLAFAKADFAEPRTMLSEAVSKAAGERSEYAKLLRTFVDLVEHWLRKAPSTTLPTEPPLSGDVECEEHFSLLKEMRGIERALLIVAWHRASRVAWLEWWDGLLSHEERSPDGTSVVRESTLSHINRLTEAMDGAKPYSRAVVHLRSALRLGREYEAIAAEQAQRDAIAEALSPLKQLPALAQSVAKDAIEGLSERIKAILSGMHVAERFKYQTASLQKREGLIVRGSFEGDIRVDVSHVANTSWLRSTLWAFIFALRQEAAEQYGKDPFPVWLFDDPQLTFDLTHRLNWSSYVAGLKNGQAAAQIVIATHDEAFAAKLRSAEFSGFEATLKGASSDSGQMLVLEGTRSAQCWESSQNDKGSNEKAAEYIDQARIYLEGTLKAMLAGQGADIADAAPNALIQRIDNLNRSGLAPWDKTCFRDLVGAASKPAIQTYLNEAHHTNRAHLTYSEASKVNGSWPGLSNLLTKCFREVRDHRLLHGLPSAFQLAASHLGYPDGLAQVLKQHRFQVLGKASAFSGRISEGTLNYEAFDPGTQRGVRLAQHDSYRLCAKTLEPVARPGDILLVHQTAAPKSKSLVIAVAEEKLFARRFVLSDASSDVAVLTANALDPFEISAPIVARKETLKLRSIVGVLFSRGDHPLSEHEIQPCASDSELTSILSRSTGLVEVSGQSAQPLALDGQHLLVGRQVQDRHELAALDGLPVIASDSEEHRYFKRLRLMGNDIVVLESLDGGGDYPPELLSLREDASRQLRSCWEVLGVLFELPN